LNYRYEDLSSIGTDASGVPNNGIDNYKYRTPGVFLQAYHAFLNGLRRSQWFGALRQAQRFRWHCQPAPERPVNHTHELNSRFALGRGFRAPTSFFEQDHGILDTSRIVRQVDKAEISDNASYTLSYAGDRLAVASSLNYNRIKNMALLDSGATDPVTGKAITLFTSADTPVTVSGGDITATYKWTPQLEATVAAERFRYDFSEPGTLAFARPETRAYLRLDYEWGPWTGMVRGTWTGPQDLAKFYDYANNQRYNFDGTKKMDKSPSFWTVDLRGEYRINRQWSAYLGADNVFDFKQSDKESMLWVDGSGAIDVTHIWGPNRGRFVTRVSSSPCDRPLYLCDESQPCSGGRAASLCVSPCRQQPSRCPRFRAVGWPAICALVEIAPSPSVINFWRADCPPCVSEMPLLAAIAREDKVRVLTVALQRPAETLSAPAAVQSALAPPMIALHGPREPRGLLARFGNSHGALPHTVVLDARRHVCAQRTGEVDESWLRTAFESLYRPRRATMNRADACR
jgi:thiol-disulfide isomerase/thioredoxin